MNPSIWPDLPLPVVFAHRGASAHAPENTLAAFQEALRRGAKAVEFDVKLSADGQVVVIHDQTVDRTTDGHGKVSELSLEELRRCDAGTWFGAAFAGERIPTLEEVFARFGGDLFMNVELTNYATPLDRLAPKVVELVKKFGLEKRVLFSSFFPHNLVKAAKLLPATPRGLLAWAGWMGWSARAFAFRSDVYLALHPHTSNLTPGLVRRVHAAGRRIHVWTVNAPDEIERLAGLGVDGIFTDDPALALQTLGGHA
ncbi:MAG: glycerophosphodiester phosphodiesterase [Chloroflexi bacterium]|nr:glycerophosphodiester phosphodiesterase [Chloroflexota bacterium]